MAQPPSAVLVYLLGFLGALAPEIVRLYGKRWKLRSVKFSWWYFVISFLYALFGGLIAVILPSMNLIAAFYAGIAWPFLVSAVLHHKGPFELKASNSKDKKTPPDSIGKSILETFRNHADLMG